MDKLKNLFVSSLKQNNEILLQFVETLPAEVFNTRRREDCWTVGEHIAHLALVQPLMMQRIRLFITEENPVMKAYRPEEEESGLPGGEGMERDLGSFSQWRDRQVKEVLEVENLVWEKKGSHPEFTEYSFEILLRHIILHDQFHMIRMEELAWVKDEFLTKLE